MRQRNGRRRDRSGIAGITERAGATRPEEVMVKGAGSEMPGLPKEELKGKTWRAGHRQVSFQKGARSADPSMRQRVSTRAHAEYAI